ncbi:MAG: secretion-associated protein EspG [Nocardia sp.]|uniref:ESX secretion-associated protein EspG n=1 Tax=Nocardia sp. TaxID=1821 RepID=UPI00261556D0|nr:ESX secretion-associated protein EspG [Nocardia sp.]MCU1648378.1 secretion-associated protein EspG [Nocardia sp.]
MDWIVAPEELADRWTTVDSHSYPYPLSVQTRRPADRTSARRFAHPEFDVALGVLVEPELRITVEGEHPDSPHTVRMLGCVGNGAGALAVQTCNAASDHAGAVHIWFGDSTQLAGRIAYALPLVHGGREQPCTVPAAELRRGCAPVEAALGAGDIDLARRLLCATRIAEGHLCIESGPAAAESAPCMLMAWIDVAGDGRYLMHSDQDVRIIPGSPAAVSRELDRAITARAGDVRLAC